MIADAQIRAVVLSALLALAACRNTGDLGGAEPKITIAPKTLTFSAIYVGASETKKVTVGNGGTAGDDLAVALDGGSGFSFAGEAEIGLGPGDTQTISITFEPQSAGSPQAVLSVTDSTATLSVSLFGTALAPLVCTPTGPCDLPVFNADGGKCVHAQAPDGTSCLDPTLCLLQPVCEQGSCVGAPNNCDDGNACTKDFCVAGQGCMNQDISAQCQGSDACQVYGCDPATGCTQSTAPNGTLCSLDDDCQMAEVCVLGACIGAQAPDGFPCRLTWEPCVDAGCESGVCRSAAAEAEVPGQLRWDAGLSGASGPLAVDDAGNSYFSYFGGPDALDSGVPGGIAAFSVCGQPLWSQGDLASVIVDGDELIATELYPSNLVVGLVPSTGATIWTLDPCGLLGHHGDPNCSLGDLTLTSQGLLYLLVWGVSIGVSTQLAAFPDAGLPVADGGSIPALLAFSRDGQPAWWVPLPQGQTPWGLIADSLGNAQVLFMPWYIPGAASVELITFSPAGTELLEVNLGSASQGSATGQPLIAGDSSLFLQGWGESLTLDGGLSFDLPGLGAPGCWGYRSSAVSVIDYVGEIVSTEGSSLVKLTAQGAMLWSVDSTISDAGSFLSPILGDDGTVFVEQVTDECSAPPLLQAINGDTGAVLWTIQPFGSTFSAQGQLALTPGSSLLTAGYDASLSGQVAAFFAGRSGPSQTAPWGRAAGGNNANRGAPGP